MSDTTNPTHFTIFRRVKIGLMDENHNRVGSEIQEQFYQVPGGTPSMACSGLMAVLAEDSESLDDLTIEDDEYESLLATALDDLEGEFAVYAGKLTERPQGEPLFTDGEIGDPIYWVVRRTLGAP